MRLAILTAVAITLLGGGSPGLRRHPDGRPVLRPAVCGDLKSLTLPGTTITLAEVVPPGGFVPGGSGRGPGAVFGTLPAFCRVAATLAPASDSDIKIEVWLPVEGWNGKFQGVGNGGWSGAVSYGALASAVARRYAAASTDTGHSGANAQFALGHPEKLIDFGWRAVHEMTVRGRAIVDAFYGTRPAFSYWTGCSSGGKQGLKEAQRFPGDYDGIVAGAPANYWTHLMAGTLWVAHATLLDQADYIPREKYAVLHRGALDACDTRDGVSDGVIEDPSRCTFDPKVVQCPAEDGPGCLTARQVAAARKIYGPATNPRTRRAIFPGLAVGSEMGWTAMAGGPNPLSIPVEHFRYVVYKDPAWDFKTMNFDESVALADELDNGLLNATDPDLRAFAARRGKLILYHGWNDQLIAPQNSIDYYNAVVRALGGERRASESVRLFMAPGMNHCGGGDGPGSFDMLAALERWVEQGVAPERVIASRATAGGVTRTRPLCPYPQVARYLGTGSTDAAESFACRAP